MADAPVSRRTLFALAAGTLAFNSCRHAGHRDAELRTIDAVESRPCADGAPTPCPPLEKWEHLACGRPGADISEEEVNRLTADLLSKAMIDATWDDEPFEKALSRFRRETGLNIVRLRDEGSSDDERLRVTLRLGKMAGDFALIQLLASVQRTYKIQNGLIVVSAAKPVRDEWAHLICVRPRATTSSVDDDQYAAQRLRETVIHAEWSAEPLKEVLNEIRRETGNNVILCWYPAELPTVTLHMGDVTADVALTRVLESVGCRYSIEEGLVIVRPATQAGSR